MTPAVCRYWTPGREMMGGTSNMYVRTYVRDDVEAYGMVYIGT